MTGAPLIKCMRFAVKEGEFSGVIRFHLCKPVVLARDSPLLLPKEGFRSPSARRSVFRVIMGMEVPEHGMSQVTANSIFCRVS